MWNARWVAVGSASSRSCRVTTELAAVGSTVSTHKVQAESEPATLCWPYCADITAVLKLTHTQRESAKAIDPWFEGANVILQYLQIVAICFNLRGEKKHQVFTVKKPFLSVTGLASSERVPIQGWGTATPTASTL